MLYASSNYAFGDFSNNPSLSFLTSDPLKYGKQHFIPNEQDKMVSYLRSWIHSKAGGGVKWGAAAALQPLPSRLPEKELFDVYDAHTKQCTLCMTAVKNTTNLRNLAVVFSVLTMAFGKSRLLKIAGGLFFAGVATLLEKLRGLYYSYYYSHQNNN